MKLEEADLKGDVMQRKRVIIVADEPNLAYVRKLL
jgi:hypothetical protein